MVVAKPAGEWTYEDLPSLPDDGRRWEIIEGELCEVPAPTAAHALIVMNLIALLLPWFRGHGGRLMTAPLDVFFPGADPVQPDLVCLLSGFPGRLAMRGVEGVPDLVVEIVSPATRGRDLLTKRALYERAAVREYWVVDPQARTLDVLALRDGRFLDHLRVEQGEAFASRLLDGSRFDTAAIFDGLDDIAE